MIFDQLKNAHFYFPLGERIAKAFQYLSQTDFTNVEPGNYEVDGENIFAIVQQYNTKPASTAKWEAHKKYIDIQYIVSGKEKMGFTESKKVIVLQNYHPNNDITIYKGEGNYLTAEEGQFVLFFPTDIHMPQLALNIPREVKKVVMKVRTDFVVETKIEESEVQVEESENKPSTEE
ncbi:MAG: YhcH/YjgK/YiaL family protein [Ignavibacteriae bacterium HGW-Ignavibacteriae-3]|nr:MAG: YhcH/YjgK/YiaL family protein [Ignavibacteriae bacterium HGW-Ignavibacteriae-3]